MGQISTSPTPPRLFLPNYGTLILCPGHLFTFYRNPDFYMTIILRLIPILIFFYSCHTFSIAATGDGNNFLNSFDSISYKDCYSVSFQKLQNQSHLFPHCLSLFAFYFFICLNDCSFWYFVLFALAHPILLVS